MSDQGPSHAAGPQPVPLRCPRCGANVAPEQDWCLECGAPARTRLAPTPNWRAPIALVAVVVLLAGLALAFAFTSLTSDDGSVSAATTAPAQPGRDHRDPERPRSPRPPPRRRPPSTAVPGSTADLPTRWLRRASGSAQQRRVPREEALAQRWTASSGALTGPSAAKTSSSATSPRDSAPRS